MSGQITVIQPRQSLVDSRGHITRVWWLFLQDIFERIGGTEALTNTELEDLAKHVRYNADSASRQALQIAQRPPRGGVGIDVVQDAAGVTLNVEVEGLVGGILPYLPRPVIQSQRAVDDASSIIANKVFGAR